MVVKRTITLLSLFFLAGASHSSFAQQDQQATPATTYQIGIFPFGGRFVTTHTGDQTEQIVRNLYFGIQRDGNLNVAYSYYDDAWNEPRIRKPDRLWIGGEVRKKPNQEIVYRLARERGLDGVVMCWGRPPRLDIYLIDVAKRKVYHKKGTTKKRDIDKLTRKLVAQFLGRPEVVPTKAGKEKGLYKPIVLDKRDQSLVRMANGLERRFKRYATAFCSPCSQSSHSCSAASACTVSSRLP